MKDPQPYLLPKHLKCPRCNNELNVAQDVSPDGSSTFHKGKLMVCGMCAGIIRVGDSALIPMTKADVLKLPPKIQKALWFACNQIAKIVTSNRN